MKKMNVKKFARTFLVLIAVFALACAFSSMAFAADGETAAAAPDNNMGIGMIAAVPAAEADQAIAALKAAGETAYLIGSVVNGEDGVEVQL